MVSKKNKKSGIDSSVQDPLDELNEIEDKTFTIERENDVFDELEIRDAESIPEYNSESGAFIKTDEGLEKFVNDKSDDSSIDVKDDSKDDSQDAVKIMDVIDEVDVNNPDNEDKLDTKRIEQEDVKLNKESEASDKDSTRSTFSSSNADLSQSRADSAIESSDVKSSDELVITKDTKKAPKIRFRPKLSHDSKKSDTKVVDNVKVDEDGVPLLNQFDTDKIKNTSFYHKFHLNKRNITQIAMILIGFLFIIYGIIQAFEEVAKISDNVMYGEHASLSIGIIFIGIVIIVLAFYKEIINLFGLGNMYNTVDSNNSNKKNKNDKKQ